MKVTLRERKRGKKKIYYHLDIYDRGQRSFESLSLFLYQKPKTALERKHNKETKELAQNIAAQRQLEYQGKAHGFPSKSMQKGSFVEYFKTLADKRQESDGNYGNWSSAMKHLKAYTPKITFLELDKSWLEGYRDFLTKKVKKKNEDPLSENTVLSYYTKVKAAIKQAVKDGYLKENISLQVETPKEKDSDREYLTLEELKKVNKTDCTSPLLKKAFIFSALTGLRWSDIEKLTWGEVQHSNEIGWYIRFRQKKTNSFETLPISDQAKELIGKKGTTDEKVFVGLNYNSKNNEKIQDWITDAGIDKKITFHCARHTNAVIQLSLGTDIYVLSKMLGHKNISTTEIYSKVIDQRKVEAAKKIKL